MAILQVDGEAFAAIFARYRRQNDLFDQLADDIRSSCLRVLVGQRLSKLRYLVAVVVGHVGMQEDGVTRLQFREDRIVRTHCVKTTPLRLAALPQPSCLEHNLF